MNVTVNNFNEVISEKDKLIVLDFWASWCGPCKMLAPIFETVEGKYPNVIFGKVNVDEEEELARQYGIVSIPTLIFIKNREVVKKSVGYVDENQLCSLIDGVM